MEWQPIKTAPKDGTKIDLWRVRLEYGTAETFDGERIPNAFWGEPYYGNDRKYDDAWVHWDGGRTEEVEITDAYLVTHWMPLPEPPAHSKGAR